jgi:hypothetical protein
VKKINERAEISDPEKIGRNPVCFGLLIIMNAGWCD